MQSQECLPQNIKNVFANNSKHYVILAGLGGFTGSYLSRAVISHLQANNIAYNSIVSLPFTHEGLIKRKQAIAIKNGLRDQPNTVFVDYDSIREMYGNFKLKDAFTIADEYSFQAFQELNAYTRRRLALTYLWLSLNLLVKLSNLHFKVFHLFNLTLM